MSDLISLNRLKKLGNEVYGFPSKERLDFGYSDGEQVEQYLFKVLSETEDLSSRSSELQSKIIDWPSEYHLTSDRANLLRGFDLSFAKTALELGSGCGAISRYLGEQGILVDAIEGSSIRADLGRRRCRGLDNVRVINANYNDLQLPKAHYDLILFVGVIEYARRFRPKSKTNRDAALEILSEARKHLAPNGVVIVAIENRLGLKYMLGHHEDHYSKRYVGIDGYPDSAGIATYSYDEWGELIEDSGFSQQSFAFPFPDYKIPRVVLSENYVRKNPYAYNHLEGLVSRDYTAPAKRDPGELIAWQTAASGDFLHTVANSFCLLMGMDQKTIDGVNNFDFFHGPGPSRKLEYAVATRKLQGQDLVTKAPLVDLPQAINGNPSENGISQDTREQPFLHGPLLSAKWLRTILIYVRRDEFVELIQHYYHFLGEQEKKADGLKIDMLPINIVITHKGQYELFDQEWSVEWEISREFVLFRALLTFIVTNWVYLKEFVGWLELHTVRDFIKFGFSSVGLRFQGFEDAFVTDENRFQQIVAADNKADVNALLDTVFNYSTADQHVYSACSWRGESDGFVESNRVTLPVIPDPAAQSLIFELPDHVSSIRGIRFDPFDIRHTERIGFFGIMRIDVIEASDASERIRWGMHGATMIADHCLPTNAKFEALGDQGGWMAVTDFPNIEIELDETVSIPADRRFKIRIDMGFCESPEYLLAHQRYLAKTRNIEQMRQELADNSQQLNALRAKINRIKSFFPVRVALKMATLFRPRT